MIQVLHFSMKLVDVLACTTEVCSLGTDRMEKLEVVEKGQEVSWSLTTLTLSPPAYRRFFSQLQLSTLFLV